MKGRLEPNTIILAGLLHDIGKAFIGDDATIDDELRNIKLKGHPHAKASAHLIKLYKDKFKEYSNLIDMVLYHGEPRKEKHKNLNREDVFKIYAMIIAVSDHLSAKERIEEEEDLNKEKKDRFKYPFVSVFNEINLGLANIKSKQAYDINILCDEKGISFKDILFPTLKYPEYKIAKENKEKEEEKEKKEKYEKIWKTLNEEFKNITDDDYLSIFYILYKTIWAVPSATPRGENIHPDISLFDHSRVSAAIALCLYNNTTAFKDIETILNDLKQHRKYIKNNPQNENERNKFNDIEKRLSESKYFILLSADMFGIQDFVYTPSNEPGTSKRLRGRSCYVSLLTDIIARYIVYELELSFVNILYCSSGEFQILLPNTKECKDKLNVILDEINELMFIWTNGKLGFVFADTEVSPLDFTNWDDVLKRVDNKMNALKKQKLKNLLQQEEKRKRILSPQEKIKGKKDICQSCGNTIPYDKEDKICDLCEIFEQIGKKLPYTKAIILHQGNGEISKNNEGIEVYKINFGKFVKAYLVIDNRKDQTPPSFKTSGEIKHLEYYTLNSTDNFINAATFENASASYGFKFIGNAVARDKENGQVLEFEKIASISEGAKKLGILKLDVDLTKLIFQIGLSAKEDSDRTISRIATLSRMLELFFSGYINTICNEKDFKDKVYIVYSGGDDLFIVGPWSLIPKLAQKIYDDFKEYTCNNEDISLSGGIFICDAKFPVKRFAYLVNDELRKSKENGRDRITMFGETVPWTKTTDGKISFKELMDFSEDLTKYLQERKISRGFLHHLLRINKLCVEGSYQYFPYLVWQITRNIKDIDVKEALYKKFITDTEGKNWVANLKIPVCYALLKSRR
ncbi:MAG: type III-A CRISPR-associated protein Cas10/Csm1 [candidate division WOR-3 bacterium]